MLTPTRRGPGRGRGGISLVSSWFPRGHFIHGSQSWDLRWILGTFGFSSKINKQTRVADLKCQQITKRLAGKLFFGCETMLKNMEACPLVLAGDEIFVQIIEDNGLFVEQFGCST